MINKKALLIFLTLTFGLTIVLLTSARYLGFNLFASDSPAMMSQIVVLVAMFIPAISAIVVQKFIAKKPLKDLGFKIGPKRMYASTYAMIALVFFINYGLTWVFVIPPDWTLASFLKQYAPGFALPLPAPMMILLLSLITFIVAPIVNMIPSLGEEIGWRGFLLPALEPIGKVKAMILSGIIWALWHTPMILIIGFTYGQQAWPGVLLHFVMVTGFGIWMGYIWFKTRSTVLAAFMHATFNANAYGIWSVIFISGSKLIIGAAGIIGAVLCLILGLFTIYVLVARDNLDK